MEFLHIGVPTTKVQENETYLEALKVYVTNPDKHPFKYEYLRFEQDTPFPEIMRKNPHVAYKVSDMAPYLKMGDVIVEPFQAGPDMRIAFIIVDEVILEILEQK